MARTRRGQRRPLLPRIAGRQVDVVQPGVEGEHVEAAADDMDHAAMRDAADMVARRGHWPAPHPAVRGRVVNFVPRHAGAFIGRVGSTADEVDLAVQRHRGGSGARAWQLGDLAPAVRGHLIDECQVVGEAILLDEATQRIDAPGMGHHRHMVGAARQRGRIEPAVGGGVVDGVVGAVEAALAIAAHDVHPVLPGRRPGHFAARYGHVGARCPAAGGAGRGRAVDHPLGFLRRRQMMRRATLKDVGVGVGRGGEWRQVRIVAGMLGQRRRGEEDGQEMASLHRQLRGLCWGGG